MELKRDANLRVDKLRICPQEFYKFDAPENLLTDVLSALKTLDISQSQQRTGGQDPGFFFNLNRYPLKAHSPFLELHGWLHQCLAVTRDNISWSSKFFQQLEITQSWINISHQGNDHAMHTHPLSILSGILSLAGHVETNFYVESIYSLPPLLCPDAMDSDLLIKQTLSLDSGVLVIFPSVLKHDVSVHSSSKKRITLSFNSFFSGTIGDPSMLSAINLNLQ